MKQNQRLTVGMTVKRRTITVPLPWYAGKINTRYGNNKAMRGVVRYIHPKGRFHTVEFQTVDGGTLRECFKGCEV